MEGIAERIAPTAQRHAPPDEVAPRMLHLVPRLVVGLVELDFAIRRQRQEPLERFPLVADDAEKPGDPRVLVVVDLHRGGGLLRRIDAPPPNGST